MATKNKTTGLDLKESVDLFGWIGALFSKKKHNGTPPTFMIHRFLASDRELANACRVLQRDVREPDLVFSVWQGLLPELDRTPRFAYVAPKKPPAEEALVARMKTVLAESRQHVEEMISVVTLTGRVHELYAEFGIDAPKEAAE